jgi:SpoVK/Ycf46/Vps4 family AAA+-type ATPase
MTSAAVSEAVQVTTCPSEELQRSWDSVIVEPEIKSKLLHHALLAMHLRPKLPFEVTAVHGMTALIGPAGTGKTTLARGLPAEMSRALHGEPMRLIEVSAHGLMSADHGQSQQLVTELLTEYLPGLVDDGMPGVVLLDEVESLAVARSESSLSANPVDVHRATDAVLTAMDTLARITPQLVFVVTSNFVKGLDEAFLSRADEVIRVPRPNEQARRKILVAVLEGFSDAFPPLGKLAEDTQLANVAARTEGLDGRQLRKLITRALARRPETATDPGQLTMEDLAAAADEEQAEHTDLEQTRVRAA